MDKAVKFFQKSEQKMYEWLHTYFEQLDEEEDYELGLAYLRSTLQVLRDRLGQNEAIQLGDQLPAMWRGLYYENWSPMQGPIKTRSGQAFLDAVEQKLTMKFPYIDHQQATCAAMQTIFVKISEGEMQQVISNLHTRVRDIFEALPHR